MAIELPKLDYEYNALEPFIDENTMRIHHDKHHQAYIDKYSAAVNGTKFDHRDVDDVLSDLSVVPESIRTAVKNHGGGHSNHRLFWKIMGPKSGGVPNGSLGKAINAKWGSFDKFKEEFSNAALNRFGSGWAWLCVDKGELLVHSTANQDSPISEGKKPLLCLDVWEHAYYLKHQNRRGEYVAAWWNIVNWKEVEKRHKEAI
ncbi:superoxide dismutase [Candidatus Woesearchaeota archaeon]|nr:superoxide dismutase [Candidatus Woesearchaeota archaeon]